MTTFHSFLLPHAFRLLSLILIAVPASLFAQWQPTNYPFKSTVNGLATDGAGNIYAAADRMYKSIDGGQTWLKSGLDSIGTNAVGVDPTRNYIYAGSFGVAVNPTGVSRSAAVNDYGVYRSTDAGATWSQTPLNNAAVWFFATTGAGQTYAACDFDGVYKTTDGGNTWAAQFTPFPNERYFSAAASPEGVLYAGSNLNFTYSTNNGQSWFDSADTLIQGNTIWNIYAEANGVVWAATQDKGIYRSTNFGVNWTQTGLTEETIYNIVRDGSTGVLYAGSGNLNSGVYFSVDNGANWSLTSLTFQSIWSLTLAGSGRLVAGTFGDGAFYTADAGNTWTQAPLRGQIVWSILGTGGTNLFAGSAELYRSTSDGLNWNDSPFFSALNTDIYRLAQAPNGRVYAGTLGAGIFSSPTGSEPWTQATLDNFGVYSIAVDAASSAYAIGLFLYKTTNDGATWTTSLADSAVWSVVAAPNNTLYAGTIYNGIWKSTDGGASWTNFAFAEFTRSLAVAPNGTVYAGTYDNGVYKSIDGGSTWFPTTLANRSVEALILDNSGNLIAGTLSGMYKSANGGGTWTPFDTGLEFGTIVTTSLFYDGTSDRLYSGTAGAGILRYNAASSAAGGNGNNTVMNSTARASGASLAVGSGGKVLRSTNDGRDWNSSITQPQQTLNEVAISEADPGARLTAGESAAALKRAFNSGMSTSSAASSANKSASQRAFGTAVSCGVGGTILRSTNGGESWSSVNNSGATNTLNAMSFVSGTALQGTATNKSASQQAFGTAVSCGVGGTILRSTDDGESWTQSVSPTTQTLNSLAEITAGFQRATQAQSPAAFGTAVSCGVGGTILRSTDGGQNWTAAGVPASANTENFIKVIPENAPGRALVLAESGVILRTTDDGITWGAVSSTPDGGGSRPARFALSQNYPNPFNPETSIKYELGATGDVSLKVFDVLGREVATVVNGRQATGNYSVRLNASKLASGVYFYRLSVSGSSGNFSETKRMVLLK